MFSEVNSFPVRFLVPFLFAGPYGRLCKLGVLVVGVLIVGVLLFGVCIRALDFWKLPYGILKASGFIEQNMSCALRKRRALSAPYVHVKTHGISDVRQSCDRGPTPSFYDHERYASCTRVILGVMSRYRHPK